MNILGRIEPQPPKGIKYMLGNELWLPEHRRSPVRLHCEEWGNIGPMELNPDIHDNGHGFRVRTSEFIAPDGATGFTLIDGDYLWTGEPIQRSPMAHIQSEIDKLDSP